MLEGVLQRMCSGVCSRSVGEVVRGIRRVGVLELYERVGLVHQRCEKVC